jgi:hypothetical protein
MPPRPSLGPPAVCPSCNGFLGWHPHTCLTCPRRGQSWAERTDTRGHRPARARHR